MKHMISYFYDGQSSMKKTFMRMHDIVSEKYKHDVLNHLPQEISDFRYQASLNFFLWIKAGFYPYEIKDKSGSRVCFLDGSDDDNDDEQEQTDSNQSIIKKIKTKIKNDRMKKINFIEDPELNYLRKDGRNTFSITIVIDKIFEKICQTIDEKLSNYFGLHFFVRRCFAGCEFGICIDPLFDDKPKIAHYLFDTNPLFLFTIQCKSTKPLLASILLIVLVFATIIATKIAKYLASPGTTITDLLKSLGKKLWKTVKNKCKDIVISLVDKYSPLKIFLEKIINWLIKQILAFIKTKEDKIAVFMRIIVSIFGSRDYSNAAGKLGSKIKIDSKLKDHFSNFSLLGDLIKIGILFILLIFAFVENFKARPELKQNANVYQNEFEKDHHHTKLEDYKSYKETKKAYYIKFEDIK